MRGWALAEQGQERRGFADTPGPGCLRATGAEMGRPYYLALLAEAYGKVGQMEEGLTALAEALAPIDKTGERWYEAELYRLKGELTLSRKVGKWKTKSKRRRKPVSQGHRRRSAAEAKSLELRAVMSLAGCGSTGQEGRLTDVRRDLRLVYRRVRHGDLKRLRRLLEESP